MPDLKKIADHPKYDSAATAASKSTIFVFVATFIYFAFFSGVSPGFWGGAAFFVAGIFLVSIVIAFPLLMLKLRLPQIAPIATIVDIVVTVLLTRAVYLWLFSQPTVDTPFEPRSFQCDEPLPEFTLSRTSDPSNDQIEKLCQCIASRLSEGELEISQAIIDERTSDVTQSEVETFISKFGDALDSCGGQDL